MGYEKSYWLPDEENVGRIWRDLYNKYLTEDASIDSYIRLILDPAIYEHVDVVFSTLERAVVSLRFGYHVFTRYGNQIFASIKEEVEGSTDFLDDRWIRRALESFESFLILVGYVNRGRLDHFLHDYEFHIVRIIDNIEEIQTDKFFPSWDSPTSLVYEVPCYLEFLELKKIVDKTWGCEESFELWNENEFDLIVRYFSRYQFGLTESGDHNDQADPTAIEFTRQSPTEWIPESDEELFAAHEYFMSHFIADFVDELLAFNRHHSVKGSATCVACGHMYPRSFYGHGQKYCSSQCKDRAKKRRQREKAEKKAFLNRFDK